MKNEMMKQISDCGSWRHMKKVLALTVSLALLCVLLGGCGQLRNSRPITDVHSLDGQRVGVALAWGPDYLLTNREDMTLMRYNSVSGAVTALRYHQVDAVAVEKQIAIDIINSVPGLRYIEEPIATDTLGFLVDPERYELCEELNAYIDEFIHTPEFEDLVERCNSADGYEFKDVPLNGSERVLYVGAVADAYPFSYYNPETDSFEGTDVEFLCHFANARGYDLVFHSDTWESMEYGVQYGQYDIGCGGVSEFYRIDIELSEGALMSNSFMPVEIVFVVVDEQNKQES